MVALTAHTADRLRRLALFRRSMFFTLTALSAVAAGTLMWSILQTNEFTVTERISWVLFTALFGWISGAFWTAVIGFIVRLRGHDPGLIRADEAAAAGTPTGRTAIVMPIYHEDVQRIGAGLDVVWASLMRRPEQEAFDLFVLSDTRDDEIAAAEAQMWRQLIARHRAAGRIFYRRRTDNVGRKAGNIAEFVRSWGAAYQYMVVLDADSIMTGRTLVQLAQLMELHPEIGILQTLPLPTGRETLFARILQFAGRLNGPMLASGAAYWHLGESSYWGHNAIIRMRAFADFCCLPRLTGKEPLGGDILSHDFVEAAFMRAGGQRCWLLPDIGGSWEELPSNAVDYAARERRWTQGNLQHVRVLPMRGLHWLSRIHLFTGIVSYITAPIWFTGLLLSSAIACLTQDPQYFIPGSHALFPQWPQFRPEETVGLLSMTAVVLFLPKIFGAILALKERQLRRGFGGSARLGVSLVLEQFFSILFAPSMMVFHTMFVLQTLAGRRITWRGQERSNRGLNFGEACKRFIGHTLLGAVWTAVIVQFAPRFFWWMLPVLAGLLLSIPVAMLSSSAGLGRRARAAGLFLIPEETTPPRELAALHQTNLASENRAEAADEKTVIRLPHTNGASTAVAAIGPMSVPVRAPLRMEPFLH